MPKRKSEEKINYYLEKIKKLEEKQRRRRDNFRRVIVYSDSSDIETEDIEIQNIDLEINPAVAAYTEAPPPPDSMYLPPEDDTAILEESSPIPVPVSEEIPQTQATPVETVVPVLASEYLLALGDSIDETPKYGDDIHPSLVQKWLPVLRKGLTKENREKNLNNYFIPSNCKLLKAPTLNLEISAAISESLRIRDKKLEIAQQQLGLGITAINRAMTSLFSTDDKVQAIKMLSDACRILSDLHFLETKQRISLLTPNLDKSFLSIVDKEDRDETLFGNDLSEKIKVAKAIEKQGLSIKKSITVQRPSTSTSTSHSRQGNWTGPSRFPSKRGGRGGPRTSSTATTRRPPATITMSPMPQQSPASQTRSSSYNYYRPRAPRR